MTKIDGYTSGYDDGFYDRDPTSVDEHYRRGWLDGYCGAYQDDGNEAWREFEKRRPSPMLEKTP
jgi:hypothetical protein